MAPDLLLDLCLHFSYPLAQEIQPPVGQRNASRRRTRQDQADFLRNYLLRLIL